MGARKSDHIRICAIQKVESEADGFASVRLTPEACPEFALSDVDTSASLFGKRFGFPLLITGMTGGVEHGQAINLSLGRAAEQMNVPMGLGSLKLMVAKPEMKPLFDLKPHCPGLFLIGNLGLSSFNEGLKVDDLLRLVESLKLDAFALHLNALQECIQPEGERNFSHSLDLVQQCVQRSPVPVLLKEVGSGVSEVTCKRLVELGVRHIDVGGRGGTSWSVIEGLRGSNLHQRLGSLFRNWGLSTEESLRACAKVRNTLQESSAPSKTLEIVATGGIRDGWQMAKALALGAQFCGVGLPLFRAAVGDKFQSPEIPQESLHSIFADNSGNVGQMGQERVRQELEFFLNSLRIVMFCSGAKKVSELASKLWQGNTP